MVYIFHSHVTTYVPSTTIKDILTRSYSYRRREKWIAVLLEYDLDIKPTKLIKGQGLEKLMAQSNYDALDINLLDVDLRSTTHLEQVKLKYVKFYILNGYLYWKDPGGVLLNCLLEN